MVANQDGAIVLVRAREGAWIETGKTLILLLSQPFASVRVRGLKPLQCRHSSSLGQFASIRARGLKRNGINSSAGSYTVRVRMDPWIETSEVCSKARAKMFASITGAWIETVRQVR
jgi:hypothetical protein